MSRHRILHRETGVLHEYVAWDQILSLDGRLWHACPVCGIGVCSPIGGPSMAHAECIAAYEKQHRQEPYDL